MESSCSPCLPGTFCDERGLVLGKNCLPGFYCPGATINAIPCPRGTFSNVGGLFNVSSCDPCSPGHYCINENLTEPTGLCSAGHYCTLGAIISNPVCNFSLPRLKIGVFYIVILYHIHK